MNIDDIAEQREGCATTAPRVAWGNVRDQCGSWRITYDGCCYVVQQVFPDRETPKYRHASVVSLIHAGWMPPTDELLRQVFALKP